MDTNRRPRTLLSLSGILDALAEQVQFRLRLYAAADVRQMLFALAAQIYGMQSEIVKASSYCDLVDWRDEDVDYFVLSDDSNELTALFRYCMAIKTNRFDAAEMYADDAVRQYLFDSELYDKVWGDLIPGKIRKRASQDPEAFKK